MWRILTIISGIVLAVSAWIGLLNNGKLEAEKADLDKNKASLAKVVNDLKETKDSLAEAIEQKEAKIAQRKAQEEEKNSVAASNETMSGELATMETSMTTDKERLASIREKMKDAPNLDELEDKIKTQTQEDATMAQQVADAEAKMVAAEARIKTLEQQVKSAEQREEDIRNHLSPASLSAQLVSVNNALGFVILNAGVNQGVVGSSRLAVMRGSEKVGELMVSAVERTRSAADIVPGSVGEGVTLMPGDKIIAIRTIVAKKDETKAVKKVETPQPKNESDEEPGEDIFGDDTSSDSEGDDDPLADNSDSSDEISTVDETTEEL